MTNDALAALRETVAVSHRLLYLTGLGTTRGHTSARIPGTDAFFIKPWPHIQMHRVRAEDLIVMDFDGNIEGAGDRKITKVSEWPIHAEIYRTHPDVGSIIHTHQKWATMMGLAGATILPLLDPELATAVAHEPVMYDEDKALIRSVEQGRAVSARMQGATACHLQNHGMVFTGPNVETATIDAIATEHLAEMTWHAKLIGAPEAMSSLVLEPPLAPRSRREVSAARRRRGRRASRPARPPAAPAAKSPKRGSTTGSGSTPTRNRSGRGRRIFRGSLPGVGHPLWVPFGGRLSTPSLAMGVTPGYPQGAPLHQTAEPPRRFLPGVGASFMGALRGTLAYPRTSAMV